MKKLTPVRIIGRIFTSILIFILCLLIFVICTVSTVFRGPSDTMRTLLVSSLMETSAMKFVPRAFFSDEEIDAMMKGNTDAYNAYIDSIEEIEITILQKDSVEASEDNGTGITIEDVYGETYCGKMMIIDDPTRVSIQVIDTFSETGEGFFLRDLANADGVVAAFNGGGFLDNLGTGNGGMPLGVTIKDGELLADYAWECPVTVGFDKNKKLIVGSFTGKQALDAGIVEACSFGPVLVKNGTVTPISGSGLNPRTAIGQRADGAILVLAIDGRQPHSLGATYNDIAAIMEDYGAVNAANLDGGSSSMLFYEGELINSLGSAVGERKIPTAFVVR
ncbi:MAG: phosphodiester glycosidase family protein [Clostridia bacterium]|nr:phosphodiester glycosidase family protein [Clostridia bacterium]